MRRLSIALSIWQAVALCAIFGALSDLNAARKTDDKTWVYDPPVKSPAGPLVFTLVASLVEARG
jgi:hypothetical protein